LELRGRVVAVAGRAGRPGRAQEADLVVVAQRLDRDLGQPREIADLVHGCHLRKYEDTVSSRWRVKRFRRPRSPLRPGLLQMLDPVAGQPARTPSPMAASGYPPRAPLSRTQSSRPGHKYRQ